MEPVSRFLRIAENEGASNEASKRVRRTIQDGCSVKALNSKGAIVGIMVNAILKRGEIVDLQSDDPIFHKKEQLINYCKRRMNLFERYPDVDKILDLAMISIEPKYLGSSVSKKLVLKSREFARERDIPLCSGLCISFYSADACKRMGFKEIFSMPWSEYLVDGKQVFDMPEPHTECVGLVIKS